MSYKTLLEAAQSLKASLLCFASLFELLRRHHLSQNRFKESEAEDRFYQNGLESPSTIRRQETSEQEAEAENRNLWLLVQFLETYTPKQKWTQKLRHFSAHKLHYLTLSI